MMGHPGLMEELQRTLEDNKAPDFGGPATVESPPPSQADLDYVSKMAATRLATSDAQASALRALVPQAPAASPVPAAYPNGGAPPVASPPAPMASAQPSPLPVQNYAPPVASPPAPYSPSPAPAPGFIPGQHPVTPQPLASPPSPQPSPGQSMPFAAKDFGMEHARFGDQAKSVPTPIAYQDSLTERVAPLPPPAEEFASSLAEEWDESLATLLLVFGVLLIACFVAPWSVGSGQSKTLFAWSVYTLEGAPLREKILPALITGTGLISILVGAFRVGPSSRALLAASLGLSPLAFQVVNTKPFAWQSSVFVLGTVLVVSGLLLRSKHNQSKVPKIMVSIAVLMLLAVYLVPVHGVVPIAGLLDFMADVEGAQKIVVILGIVGKSQVIGLFPFICILLSLLVWMPGSNHMVTKSLAVLLLFSAFLAGLGVLIALLVAGDDLAPFKAQLSTFVFLPLAFSSWLGIASYGICGLVNAKLKPE